MDNISAVILAGGQGERLSILALERAKPAIPFAGKYRIIDFSLSNCANSGIQKVAVLTQYRPLSLAEHIGIGMPWGLYSPDREVRVLQPYLAREEGHDWYKGTADAVYQNLEFIEEQDVELVLVLSGDHVYNMDYIDMLKFHEERRADATLAVTHVSEEELSQFGTVMVNDAGQITEFQEKVKHPKSDMVSMGVYLFNKDTLRECLEEDARSKNSKHDFGRNVLPRLVKSHRVFAYNFEGYWRDVGTVQTYWQSNMDLLEMPSGLLFNTVWPIRTKEDEQGPPAIVSQLGSVVNSMVSDGCVIEGRVEHSVLSPGVRVAEGAVVKDSVILSDTIVGRDSVIDRSILDKVIVVEAGCHIGFGDDLQINHKEPRVLNSGITIVGKGAIIPAGAKIGRNCVIFCDAREDDFPGTEVQSGETIKPKRGRARRKA
ncbi:glucose-1-phosphate adenylyltransferase [Chloroflexota bacterium]